MTRLGGLVLVLPMVASLVNIPRCDQQKSKPLGEQQSNRATPAKTSAAGAGERPGAMDGEIQELAAGAHCTVFESFVFVARDAQTYQALKTINLDLPDRSAEFFSSHAVIAAFLGQRRTGGFGVDITQDANGLVRISEHKPKGMVTMALTAPFRIVAVSVKTDAPLGLSLDAAWKERLRGYRVASGELTVTGGFAGIHENSSLAGSVQVMREQTLATLIFELKSTGKRRTQLTDVSSGTVVDSVLSLRHLDSHALSGAIQSPFRVRGQFTNDEQELSLDLETVESPNISDNFSARASVRAIATTPRPPDRAISDKQ